RIEMGSKDIKNDSWSNKDKSAKDSEAVTMYSGPEATMVAAAKHFSSAHKVRLI
ncbi:hypothetical protein R6Q59_000456, partial [Mikania micrantha]